MPPTDLNWTESESCSDHCNICNAVGKKTPFTEEIQPYHSKSNCSRSECYNNNAVDSNRNIGNGLNGKKLCLDDFEGPEELDLYNP